MTQDLVTLSGQADLKASILITAASIVVSVSITAVRFSKVRWSLATLSVFALVALIMAILAVLPRGTRTRVGAGTPPIGYNPLYFAHAASVGSDVYVAELAALCRDDSTLYEAMTRQIHSLSYHLQERKFRHLRRAYAWLVAGFLAAALVQAIVFAVG